MAWPLLDDLRAFVARENWEYDGSLAMDFRIADETGVGRLDNEWLDGMTIPVTLDEQLEQGRWRDSPAVKWPDPDRSRGAPFLESIDAAALLEKELVRCLRAKGVYMPSVLFSHTWWPLSEKDKGQTVVAEINLSGVDHIGAWARTEPVARTLAALEAGHRLGIWPTAGGG